MLVKGVQGWGVIHPVLFSTKLLPEEEKPDIAKGRFCWVGYAASVGESCMNCPGYLENQRCFRTENVWSTKWETQNTTKHTSAQAPQNIQITADVPSSLHQDFSVFHSYFSTFPPELSASDE